MSLDGIFLSSLCNEFSNTILNGKINKINQPEKDEIILIIRNNGQNYKLLLTVTANNPRATLVENNRENPIKAFNFCMFLRKNLTNSTLIAVEQISLDRIIKFKFLTINEFFEKEEKSLIIEIMGKHSNIFLINEKDNIVLGSIKKIPIDLDTPRTLYPGGEYTLPPNSNKTYPIDVTKENFFSILSDSKQSNLKKRLYSSFIGLSPLVSSEILYRSNIDLDISFSELNNSSLNNLYSEFTNIYDNVKNNIYDFNIIYVNNIPKYFSCVELKQFSEIYTSKDFQSPSIMIEDFYSTKDKVDRMSQKSSELRKFINNTVNRVQNKIVKLNEELKESKDRELIKIKADILSANIHKVKSGDTFLETENFYSEDLKLIKINLDKALNPTQNAQKLYKKYSKLKSAENIIIKQLEVSRIELEYLETILYNLENVNNANDIDEIRGELATEGFIKHSSKNKKSVKASKPYEYISSDGFKIYVGKNNVQNDKLTLKTASKSDIWLHTKDIPGSHVIIITENREVPETTIYEAANLAGYYSKGKNSSNIPIDYAFKRHVKKPSGAKPGMVIYENNNTVYITPIEPNLEKI